VRIHVEVGSGQIWNIVVVFHLPVERDIHGGGTSGEKFVLLEDRGEGVEGGRRVSIRVLGLILGALSVGPLDVA
jgi:hypothetical protein